MEKRKQSINATDVAIRLKNKIMKTRFYKQSWFWLMIISLSLISMLILMLFKIFPCNIFTKEITWTIIGTVITSISVFAAVVSFVKNENIRKMQATYDAYNKFKETYFESKLNHVMPNGTLRGVRGRGNYSIFLPTRL